MSSKLNSPANNNNNTIPTEPTLELPVDKNLVNDILLEILGSLNKPPVEPIVIRPEVKSPNGQIYVIPRLLDQPTPTTRVTNMSYYNASSSGLYNTGNSCPGKMVLANLLKENQSVGCYRDVDTGLTYIMARQLGFNMEFINTQEKAGFGRQRGDYLYWVYKTNNKNEDFSLPIMNERIKTQIIESRNKLRANVKYTGDAVYFTVIENSTGKIESKTDGRKTGWVIMRVG